MKWHFSEHCQPQEGQGICVGGDEVFFGLPVLVLVELASGYVLTEVQCEDRSYETWQGQIQQWWSQGEWQCHFMVSDRAKALIKLATEALGCVSVADLFHALRALAQPIGSAIGCQQARLAKLVLALKAQLKATTNTAKQVQLEQSLTNLLTQQVTLSQEQQHYDDAITTISVSIHPFNLNTQEPQTFSDITTALQKPLEQLRCLGQIYGGQKAIQAIETFETQLPDIAQGIHAWWQWTTQGLATQPTTIEVQNWVLGVLLPWIYWLQQADKTQQQELRARYQHATALAAERMVSHPLTQSMPANERQTWIDWARWMANNYGSIVSFMLKRTN